MIRSLAYPRAMVDLLPVGFLGLMLAAFLAAFMSTPGPHNVNLSAAHIVNDHRPFLARPKRAPLRARWTDRFAARSYHRRYDQLLRGPDLRVVHAAPDTGRGIGLVYVARWFWWRVNAWSR